MSAAGGRRTNQRADKKPRDPCAVVSANCCPKGARRDDRFEEQLGFEAPIVAILAAFSRKRVARATSRGSGEASRVGNDVGASLPGFGRLYPCWLYFDYRNCGLRFCAHPPLVYRTTQQLVVYFLLAKFGWKWQVRPQRRQLLGPSSPRG